MFTFRLASVRVIVPLVQMVNGSQQLKIVSGGQTGADRAGLDWAIAHGISHGGWCPKGRKAEDGPIPAQYQLQETSRADYAQRTEWNVRDSDSTVIFTVRADLSGGSKRTAECARKHGKPCLHLGAVLPPSDAARQLRRFIADHRVGVLNVAGSRASKEPAVAEFVRRTLDLALGRPADPQNAGAA